MTQEIQDKIVEQVESRTKYLDITYDDGLESDPKDFEDDCMIHISRGKYRFVFYNGQEAGCFNSGSVPRFAKLVDGVLGRIMTKHNISGDIAPDESDQHFWDRTVAKLNEVMQDE